jgi:elongation factor 1 alpha-like protein
MPVSMKPYVEEVGHLRSVVETSTDINSVERDVPQVPSDWFRGISWYNVPLKMQGELVPAFPIQQPKLLGGSSKLAKIAEERRKKAAASQSPSSAPNGALSSLDRLSKPKDTKENVKPTRPEPRKYPVRPKREPTPPPKEPSPEPEEPKEELPNLRASPTEFAKTMATSERSSEINAANEAVDDLFRPSSSDDPFKGPSPDDNVFRAQGYSKGINK